MLFFFVRRKAINQMFLLPYVLGKEMHETKEGYIAKEEEGCDS
jgi:hypothetical protein